MEIHTDRLEALHRAVFVRVLYTFNACIVGCGNAGTPEDSGIALQAVRELGPDFPLFGVCMGHQCIGQVFGGQSELHPK